MSHDPNDPDPRDLLRELWEAVYGREMSAMPYSPDTLWRMCINDVKRLRTGSYGPVTAAPASPPSAGDGWVDVPPHVAAAMGLAMPAPKTGSDRQQPSREGS